LEGNWLERRLAYRWPESGSGSFVEHWSRPISHLWEFLSRHLRADWGDLCHDDKTENELRLKYGFRSMSSYLVTDTEKLWVITEADRSVTTLLLPVEY